MNGWLRYNVRCSADVAQSVEHLIGNEEVGSSNLLISSKNKNRIPKGMRFLFSLWYMLEIISSMLMQSIIMYQLT